MADVAIREAQPLADVHSVIIQRLLHTGRAPSLREMAALLGIRSEELTQRLHQLAEIHGLVLHPHTPEPWVIHPFSTTPTLHFVEGKDKGWWAPCIWCALGIAQLAGGDVRIHTRLGAETEPLILEIRNGLPTDGENIVVHFSIPPRRAWDSVHQHCSMVLPFRSHEDIEKWCAVHGLAFGEAVPLQTVSKLAARWYGPYASNTWRKWTVEQAQQIFHDSGLTSAFWELSGQGTY